MLGTLIKALEVDFKNVDDERYLRSATHLSQNLSRILSVRKHYPEFKAKKALMFPRLAELGKLSKKEGLCLTYWHDCGDISEFRAVLGTKTVVAEAALLASRPSRFKTASLSRFMQRGEDKVLLSYLTDVSKTKGANEPKRVFNTQAHRQQVTGLLYQLHVLEEQLQAMIARHSEKLDFTPDTSFAPRSFRLDTNFVAKDFVVPISFDKAPAKSVSSNQPVSRGMQNSTQPFDTTGPVDIWYSLAEDPRTPYRFLVWLSENHNPYVSQRALTTLQRQKDAQQMAQQVAKPGPYQVHSGAFAS